MLAAKLVGYFLLWCLWSYGMHVFAHSKVKRRWNFMKVVHAKHHAYSYGESKWPPWHDFFFWFGDWRSSLDVYLTFTLPLVVLVILDPLPGAILLGFHYLYEVFLSRNVADHNPDITGPLTEVIPIGEFHLRHHKDVHCNFSFFLTLWDRVFGTTAASVQRRREARKRG